MTEPRGDLRRADLRANLRRGFYDLGTHVRPTARLAEAFAELALVI